MNFGKALLATAACLAVGTASAASPNPATTTFQVLFKVNKACSVAATNLDLGAKEGNAAETVITAATPGTVTVTCSKKTPYTVGLLPSNNSTTGAGLMAAQNTPGYAPANADTVAYQLYSNAALTTVWGNVAGTNTVAGTGTGTAQAALSVYGKATTTLNTVAPDDYKDTVTVSVAY